MSSVEGVREAIARARQEAQRIARTVATSLEEMGNRILDEAFPILPVDTGDMAASRFVQRIGVGLDAIVYAGYAAPYAIYVHEDPTKAHGRAYNLKYAYEISIGLYHLRRDEEQYKFLENTIKDLKVQDLIMGIIRSRLEAVSGSFYNLTPISLETTVHHVTFGSPVDV